MSDLGTELLRCGLEPGDIVAAIGGNTPEIWTLLRATEETGLVLAVFNDGWSRAHLERLVRALGPRLVVGYGPRRSRAEDIAESWFDQDGGLVAPWPAADKPSAPSGLEDDVRSSLVFCTSGSTGDPKCVVSSPRNRAFSASTIGRYLGLERGQCIIDALSPSFDYGFYQGLMAREFGLAIELVGSTQMTGEIIARLRKQARIVLPLTPALAARLLRAIRPDETLPQVEIVTLTGGATALGLRQRLKQAFPRARIFAMYGLTECKRVAYLEPDEFLEYPSSCGREMPGVEGEIVDSSGRSVGRGNVGELTVKGPNVCLGYWGDAAATARRFRRDADGTVTLFTGDLFRRDPQGRLEFVGRDDALVKLRDERVSLGAIERELRRSTLVLDLALEVATDSLGIPMLRARVVPQGNSVTEVELIKSFRKLVSRAGHLPHQVIVAREIAVNAHGKHASAPASENHASPQP